MEFPGEEEIRSLCTDQSFRRGRTYFERGKVTDIVIGGGEIRATVQGTHAYEVSIQLSDELINTACTCPYDYAGDCKHIVATLLAAADHHGDSVGQSGAGEAVVNRLEEIEALLEETPPDELRRFLREALVGDRRLRERFVAAVGEAPAKTVREHKADIDREFDAAADRHGLIDDRTWIDFSPYHDLAETHRDRGDVETATAVYRAIAEAIIENLDRIDDSGGHYGGEIERALTGYAETIVEADLDHGRKRPHIEYLCREFVADEYGFPGDQYEDALHTICTSRADLEHWRARLESAVPALAKAAGTSERPGLKEEGSDDGDRQVDSTSPPKRATASGEERPETVLFASDFSHGPLAITDFVGEALDIDHLAVGPLEPGDFVGEAFDDFVVDDPTTVEAHTLTGGSDLTGASDADAASSYQIRHLLSTYLSILSELEDEEAIDRLLERTYLESSRFCERYARRLIEANEPERALRVLEAGIDTFGRPAHLRWLAADLYRERDPERYRETLERLFLDHGDWDAFEELKSACRQRAWAEIVDRWERQLRETDPTRLIELYIREDELESAFEVVTTSDRLAWLQRYREPVAQVDPERYFERYRELLEPFAAGETGRRHYRTIADHLEEMRGLVDEERFDAFVEQLRERHANRPAFLDELEKAGF